MVSKFTKTFSDFVKQFMDENKDCLIIMHNVNIETIKKVRFNESMFEKCGIIDSDESNSVKIHLCFLLIGTSKKSNAYVTVATARITKRNKSLNKYRPVY